MAEAVIKPNNCMQPGIPSADKSSTNSITLSWDKPECAQYELMYYVLQYRQKGVGRWITKETSDCSNVVSLTGLKRDTCYEFRVRAIFTEDNEGPYSEINSNIRTKQCIQHNFIDDAAEITNDQPAVYRLQIKEDTNSVNSKAKSRRCTIANDHGCHESEKTIILLGETGSGKSTLIDGIANYLMGVEWEDDWRFRIIDLKDEEINKKNDQSQSQTEWITRYTIPSSRSEIKYTLNVIDTPGFGDTRGIERDKVIVEQIKLFFETPPPKGISVLDAVCFVTKAPMPRLTEIQRYIFESVLSLFGKDISNNIFVFVTFADADIPPVIKAIETAKVPFRKAFKFNNSALFRCAKDNADLSISQMYWNMGKKDFNVFFTELEKTETRSLQLTTEVLYTLKRLDGAIHELHPQIRECLCRIDTIREENRVVEEHMKDISERIEFKYDVLETSADSTERTPKALFGFNKIRKWIYDIKETFSKRHATDPCHYIFRTRKVTKESYELNKKYNIDENAEYSIYLEAIKERFNQEVKNFSTLIQQILNDINELKQKALECNVLGQLDYIEILIKTEEREDVDGYQTRVEFLKKFKEILPGGHFVSLPDKKLVDLQQEFFKF